MTVDDEVVAPMRSGAATVPDEGGGRAPARKSARPKPALPYFLVVPAVVLFLAFVVAPGIYALVLSFQARKVSGGLLGRGSTVVFAGIDNYLAVLGDVELWGATLRMIAVAAISIPFTVGLALLFALMLDVSRARLTRFTRLAIFVPYAVPGVIATLMWGFLYLPATSPIGGSHIDYFSSVGVFFSVGNIAVWGATGFNMIVIFTALRALPPEIYEAARLDGCSEFQMAWRIKAPLVRPAVVMCTLFSTLAALQLFNEPNTLRPLSNAISSTWVPLMKIYNDAFVDSDLSQAAATSVVFTVVTLGVSFVAARLIQRRVSR
ncbi:carbohydrate ABC transporter permease [Pseudonocardia sp. GCM10023141]|uniref:carbohydrate ABC transporter permease n=1 Tax=Pseudonocardia sp. GCM10023141 TaxID=3252653 RepID=UPI003620DFD9